MADNDMQTDKRLAPSNLMFSSHSTASAADLIRPLCTVNST